MNGSGNDMEPSRAAETPDRKTGLSRPRVWFVSGVIAVCVVGAGMRMIGRGGMGDTAETAAEYAARIVSRDNLARFGFVRAELARDAGDADAAAALTMLETQFDSNGILDWLIAQAEKEPENKELRHQIADLANLLERQEAERAALSQIYELDPRYIEDPEYDAHRLAGTQFSEEAARLKEESYSAAKADGNLTEMAEYRMYLGSRQEAFGDVETAEESSGTPKSPGPLGRRWWRMVARERNPSLI